ncbi:MAG: hypothetical protein ABJA67_15440 [Chthonomonadales bacterium]
MSFPNRKNLPAVLSKLTSCWLLLAILWFNTGASLMHTCGNNGSASEFSISQGGSTCAVCEWQATEKPIPVTPVEVDIVATLIDFEYPSTLQCSTVSATTESSARGPPSLHMA